MNQICMYFSRFIRAERRVFVVKCKDTFSEYKFAVLKNAKVNFSERTVVYGTLGLEKCKISSSSMG